MEAGATAPAAARPEDRGPAGACSSGRPPALCQPPTSRPADAAQQGHPLIRRQQRRTREQPRLLDHLDRGCPVQTGLGRKRGIHVRRGRVHDGSPGQRLLRRTLQQPLRRRVVPHGSADLARVQQAIVGLGIVRGTILSRFLEQPGGLAPLIRLVEQSFRLGTQLPGPILVGTRWTVGGGRQRRGQGQCDRSQQHRANPTVHHAVPPGGIGVRPTSESRRRLSSTTLPRPKRLRRRDRCAPGRGKCPAPRGQGIVSAAIAVAADLA